MRRPGLIEPTVAKYLISFPSAAMRVTDAALAAADRDSHAVIEAAKAAAVPPVLVAADGSVAEGGYPWAPSLDGGFAVLELPSRAAAVDWAARLAQACRCSQELRVFMFDPQS